MTSDKNVIADIIIDPDYAVVDSIVSCENDEGFIFNIKHLGIQKDQVVYAVRPSLVEEVICRLAIKNYKSNGTNGTILIEDIATKVAGKEPSDTIFNTLVKLVNDLEPDEVEDFFTDAISWRNFADSVTQRHGYQRYKDAIGIETMFLMTYKGCDYYIIKCKKTAWEGFGDEC